MKPGRIDPNSSPWLLAMFMTDWCEGYTDARHEDKITYIRFLLTFIYKSTISAYVHYTLTTTMQMF